MIDDQRRMIVGAGVVALAAVLDEEDVGGLMEGTELSVLVRLEYALRDLLPVIREKISAAEQAASEQAASDVPLSGPVALCNDAVVNLVLAYARGSRGDLTLEWSVETCPKHLLAHLTRARHAVAPVARGRPGDTSFSILPLSSTEQARCGSLNDYLMHR